MTPEKQRIEIATACGWVNIQRVNKFGGRSEHGKGLWACHPHAEGTPIRDGFKQGAPLPDYLNDLNAMHEAEKVLGKINMIEYVRLLRHHAESCTPTMEQHFAPVVCSTAPQRAEAFLRTIGKWEDGE